MLEQSGGRTCGWRREEEQAEAHRVREIGQLGRKLKIQLNPKVEIEAVGDKEARRGVEGEMKNQQKCNADLMLSWNLEAEERGELLCSQMTTN